MWVARDKNGKLYLFTVFPERYDSEWNSGDWKSQMEIPSSLFPNLKWENEPLEVELNPKGAFDAIYEDLQKAEELLRGQN